LIRYFDASALVKRYVAEPDSPSVARLLRDSSPATCRLTEAEIGSALARRRRKGDLAPGAHDAALAMMRADFARLRVVELAPELFAAVHPLFARHLLRARDALHLAAALALRDGPGTALEFVCYDDRLSQAARAEGLHVRP
jgi:uncharacterized protein